MKKLLIFITIFLLLSSPASAQWQRFDFFDFRGGLNDAFSAIEIKDNEASTLQNVVFTTGGNFKTRDGFDNVNTATEGATVDFTGGIYYRLIDGTEYLVTVAEDDEVKKMDFAAGAPDGTWDDITGALVFTITQNDLADFAIGEDTLFFTDGLGTNPVMSWDGAAASADVLDATAPDAKYVAYHKTMAFAAGDTTNPSTLYFSDLGDITEWAGGLSGNVTVETNDGSIIRGIKVGFDALYIWKDNSIWRLAGDDKDNFRLQRMVYGIGTLSGQSIDRIGNDFVFVSTQGAVYLYDGNIRIEKISAKIQGTIDNLAFTRFQYSSGIIFDEDYYLSVSSAGAGQHNIVLVYDTFHLAWTKFDGMDANCFFIAPDANDKDMLVFGNYDGFVYNYPEGTNDNGTAIDVLYKTKQYRFPELAPGMEKDLHLLKVYATQKGDWDLIVEVRTGFEAGGTSYNLNLLGVGSLWGTAVYGVDVYGGQNLIIGRFEPAFEDEFFQILYSNGNVDEPIEVKGHAMFLELSERL